MRTVLLPGWNGNLGRLPKYIVNRPYWQYGAGKHFLEPRVIVRSFIIPAYMSCVTKLLVSHFVQDGIAQRLFGQSTIRFTSIHHLTYHELIVRAYHHSRLHI